MLKDHQKETMRQGNEREYGRHHDFLTWVADDRAREAQMKRDALLSEIWRLGELGAKGTKADISNLSPGCQRCMEGLWSCLFINGQCNGRCFYCPTPQDEVGVPTTNHLAFDSPDAYADYVDAMGFTGVSISGGEPFITFERSLSYLSAVRERLGKSVHLWLYTNGTRVTRDKLKQLAAAGLDEIRFDIGAINYRLKKPALASGIIPTVTVEIPMVPEEEERLKGMLPDMAASGISHLNLHQLRLTPHNIHQLGSRDYTFLHGEKVTVLESELAALEMVVHGLKSGVPLGINYCSFAYKHRFQGAGIRARSAEKVAEPWEAITENGYIRSLWLEAGSMTPLHQIASELRPLGVDTPAIHLDESGRKLYLTADIVPDTLPRGTSLNVSYAQAAVIHSSVYSGTQTPLSGTSLAVERQVRCFDTEVDANFFRGEIAGDDHPYVSWERITPDLLEYF